MSLDKKAEDKEFLFSPEQKKIKEDIDRLYSFIQKHYESNRLNIKDMARLFAAPTGNLFRFMNEINEKVAYSFEALDARLPKEEVVLDNAVNTFLQWEKLKIYLDYFNDKINEIYNQCLVALDEVSKETKQAPHPPKSFRSPEYDNAFEEAALRMAEIDANLIDFEKYSPPKEFCNFLVDRLKEIKRISEAGVGLEKDDSRERLSNDIVKCLQECGQEYQSVKSKIDSSKPVAELAIKYIDELYGQFLLAGSDYLNSLNSPVVTKIRDSKEHKASSLYASSSAFNSPTNPSNQGRPPTPPKGKGLSINSLDPQVAPKDQGSSAQAPGKK
jgi:hypothetical protein